MKLAERMSRLGTENAFTVLAEVQKLAASGRDIVSLGIGDPDFDTPANVREAAKRALDAGRTHYGPSAGVPALREAAAAYLTRSRGVEFRPDEIVVTPGAKPILFHTILALAEPGDEVIYPNPGFPIYESVVNFAGAKPVPMALVEGREFRLDVEQLRRAVSPRTRMIILNSPNNPTGGVLSREDLEAVAEAAQECDAWVLADEIYSEFLFEGRHASITQIPGMKERTILLDGFSKTFAMTGWRLGYGAMPAALAEKIAQMNTNSVSCTATFVQDAGVEALNGPQDAVRAMIGEFRARRDLAIEELNRIPGISCVRPNGAFYAFPNVTGACRKLGLRNAEEFQHAMLYDGGVAVLARSNFGSRNEGEEEEYVRISFATSRELLREGLRRMRALIERA
ncbi:MAG TPA: pyridoxal phosphate-dependent aminotransferase, partial [Armatimonadota bacterium]|nr:pyridoxal phosphate-dependent aminotransferase [Armatimonadota bacterium]